MNSNNLDARVYPIDEPKGNTLAFASVAVDDLAAIRGIRVVDSVKGLFIAIRGIREVNGSKARSCLCRRPRTKTASITTWRSR
jgi:DNA-binding cell septation regulator SpoVG